jgi:hypothetical protein
MKGTYEEREQALNKEARKRMESFLIIKILEFQWKKTN